MKFILIALFLSLFIWFASLVLKVLKEQIARIFTQDYKELKQMYPAPLHAWGGLTGSLATRRIADFQLRGTLKLDVYKDMLIVSTLGKGLCLHYDTYVLKQKKALFGHYLVIENILVQNKSSGSFFVGVADFGSSTNLQILLPEDKRTILLKLAQKEENFPASIS